jgi:hypothetical protein
MSVSKLNDGICQYISQEEYDSYVAEPSITESDVKFKEDSDLDKILAEFDL